MSGDGDGWVYCAAGHRHWGRFGAAGLLISDGERAILQHRAPWTHEGDTWGVPGGARDSHEDATTTALREAQEEGEIAASSVDPIATWVDDHGGWSYTTVLARPVGVVTPWAANAESTDIRWWWHNEIDELPLHHGLAGTWPHLRSAPTPVAIVVDVRADPAFGSWLAPGLAAPTGIELLIRGIPGTELPNPLQPGRISTLLPWITIVGADHGAASSGNGRRPAVTPAPWWHRAHTTRPGGPDPDDAVYQAVLDAPADRDVIVVTGDAVLQARLADHGSVVGAQWLIELLARAS